MILSLILVLTVVPGLIMGQCDSQNHIFPSQDTKCVLSQFTKLEANLMRQIDKLSTALNSLQAILDRHAEEQNSALHSLEEKVTQLSRDSLQANVNSHAEEQNSGLNSLEEKVIHLTSSPVVILIRKDGSENFYRPWADYKAGFGSLNTEYWIGLDELHRLTYIRRYGLRVHMEAWNGTALAAYYRSFSVGPESGNYVLSVGGYDQSSSAGDSLVCGNGKWGGTGIHNGMKFSTYDRDNDKRSSNCARSYRGGWWYNACHVANPTGEYLTGGRHSSKGINWQSPLNNYYSFKSFSLTLVPK